MSRSRIVTALAVLIAISAAVAVFGFSMNSSGSAPTGPAYVPGELLLKFKPNADSLAKIALKTELGGVTLNTFRSKAEHWKLGPGIDVQQALRRLAGNPLLEYAEPNYLLSADIIPNDPGFPNLWGMYNTGQTIGGVVGVPDADIDADLAWNVSTGSSSVIVAVIDTGVDYNHPDLAANIWTNPGEIPGNGIDDDGNGYVDDVRGYDFYNNDGDPFDDNSHGTHCSGTIGGIGDNGIGVAGVTWNVKIMPVKFLSSGGSGSTANAVLSVQYATMMGAHLSSNSWGGGGFSQALYDAIAEANANGIAFVAAAGNGYGTNTDVTPNYPSAYDLPNIIAVAATNNQDQLADFSNYGPTTVDLAAPGDEVYSTTPGNTYGYKSGTSMATPHVAGACALIKAVNPSIPLAQMKQVLLNSVDHIPAMAGKCVSNGRLNVFFAIAEPDTAPPASIGDLATTDATSNTVGLTWTSTGDDGATGTAAYYEVRYSTAPIDEMNWAAATRAGNEPTPLVSGTPQSMEVRNLVANTMYYFAIKAVDEWGNAGPISNVATATTLPPPTGQVDPTSVAQELTTGGTATQSVTLSNIGAGTLDFTIPEPSLGMPMSAPADPLELGKDEPDPRPGVLGSGGPDAFGYRWVDSDQPGGPAFNWTDISTTGTPVGLTNDDATSGPIALGFNFPFYGTFFDSIRVCTNGWLSFTSGVTSYSNQPLPNSGGPENMVAPFWDDLNPGGVNRIFFQSFGNRAIVQWQAMPHYGTTEPGTYTFQAILEASGAITYQYLTVSGTLNSSTIGIQNATKTDGLTVAYNSAYVHDNLAVRFSSIPRWLIASPTSGRLREGQSKLINLNMNASGLEGGTYPGAVNILTNDPAHPVLTVNVSLHVLGAPDIDLQPTSLEYGDRFVGLPHDLTLIVANEGTDTLHVTDILPSDPQLTPVPRTFDVPRHSSQTVTVTWRPTLLGPFSGSLTVQSSDPNQPSIVVPVSGNGIPAPVMVYDPTFFNESLYTGQQRTLPLTVSNSGGSDLIVDASADLGGGVEVYADDVTPLGSGGPDGFGYKWKDSDASGGPTYNFIDISGTGTTISFTSSDDALSSAITMGMTFPFYGSNFTQLKVSTNGWLTFDTTDTSSRNSNVSLPSASGAKFMVCPFWDDLHLRTGNVKYKYDGTRFIVQYTGVGRYTPSTGQSYTFQVQLYPNGKILFMYNTMSTGYLNSATIGIQNGLRTIGLTANYNTNYVHNSMAVQFSRTPDWLVVTPSHAVIPAGGNRVFDVTFDSTDRLGGVLSGAVVLRTNIPGQEQERIPATLTVIGVPIAATIPTAYDYGTKFTGYPYSTTFDVVNNGTDNLRVTNVYADHPSLSVSELSAQGDQQTLGEFVLPPGMARSFSMVWYPTTPMTLSARVHVISNDPVNPDKTLPVTGVAIDPPVAGVVPPDVPPNVDAGSVTHRPMTLNNSGASDLTFVTEVQLASGATVVVDHSPELKKEEEDNRTGQIGSPGPDMFGYTYRTSDQPGGPTFDWFDIGTLGTTIPFASQDDSNYGPIPIGFAFPFYGKDFITVRACTNGFLSFTDSSTSLTNYPLPSTSGPANLLAVFWDDLHQRNGNAKFWSDGNRFIVQWTNWDQFTPSGQLYTFQAILYRNGRIKYQYLSMTTNDLAGSTIGIQNEAKNDGLYYVYNEAGPYIHDFFAVEFLPPAAWLSIAPESGTVAPGGSVELDVTIDATNLIGGDYAADILILTNDPARAEIRIPVRIHVTGIPDIDANPASLTFPMTYVGYTRTLNTTIKNVGTDVLTITGATISGDFSFTGLTTPVSLPVGASVPVTVTFAPTGAGTRTGSLDVTSDDLDEPTLSIPLEGPGLFPPELAVSPDSLSAILPPASTTTRMLQVCNTGGSDLNWTSKATIISGASVAPPYPPYELGKDEVDTHPGILGSGGPDVFGYRWTDSDDPGGPVFDWVDITGVGTPITTLDADDKVVAGIPIGFNFPFYGNSFNTLKVSSNGWLSFSYTGTTSYLSNYALPSTSGVPNMIAGFWDDLSFSSTHGSGRAYYHNDGSRFILSFVNVPHYSSPSTGLYTFQWILYPNGRVVTQYLSVSGLLNSMTIGIQNAAMNDGLTTVFNANYVHNNLAVEFKAIPQWITLSPESGVVGAGFCQDVTATFDSTDLDHGVHQSTVRIQAQNDPYLAFEDVPVTLTVNQKPVAVPGAHQTVECTGNNSAPTALDGTGSSDPDGDPITYFWSAPGITFDDPTSATPYATFPLGDTVVTLVVNDGYESSDPATMIVSVRDTMPPTIAMVTASPNVLWPPNHDMVTINTTVVARDVCDPSVMITLASATSSEPDDALGGGDGHTTNDIQDAGIGTADFLVQLRAERQGAGSGRFYTLTYGATDHSGNSAATMASEVQVPHDMGSVVEPIRVRLSGASQTQIVWDQVQGAAFYDVIRGSLESLRIEGSNVSLGHVTCIERASLDTSTAGNEDVSVPAPGKAFFYAVQFNDGSRDSSYGSESVGRARVVGSGDCP